MTNTQTMKRKWEIDAMVKKIEREALSDITVDEQKVAAAEKLGREAFARGAKAVPAHDRELMALIAGDRMGDSIPALKAWNRGWDKANLAAEVHNQ